VGINSRISLVLAFIRYWGNLGINELAYHLFIGFKDVCDSVRVEVLYNILIESDIAIELVRIIKIFK
jgi:hypothetical protein